MHWDWGLSRLGRCPYDPREYTGRAAAEALRAWLEGRLKAAPEPRRSPDVAHERVILIRSPDRLGEVVWDPQMALPAKQTTTKKRRKPVGLAPP